MQTLKGRVIYMAKADKNPKKQIVEYTYTLELSELEASVIMALVGAVGGFGEERQACGKVYQALRDVGLCVVGDPWGGKPETIAQKVSAKLEGKPIHFKED
jgi:hypothetical protein